MIKVNSKCVEIKRFPDGALNIKGDDSIWDDNVTIAWHYENDSEFMAVAFLTKYYQAHGNEVFLYLPYVPNARMDRVGNMTDIFSMKYFGELINSLNLKRVCVMDVHSSVASAVIKNCCILSSGDIVENVLDIITQLDNEAPIMFYPDEGSVKRYGKELDVSYAFGMKNRDWATGEILGLDILGLSEEQIKGKNILIRDDICSRGGTFYHSAKKLKELGANKIYLFVTHCENTILEGELLTSGLIERVFTTDSIFTKEHEKISVYKSEV